MTTDAKQDLTNEQFRDGYCKEYCRDGHHGSHHVVCHRLTKLMAELAQAKAEVERLKESLKGCQTTLGLSLDQANHIQKQLLSALAEKDAALDRIAELAGYSGLGNIAREARKVKP